MNEEGYAMVPGHICAACGAHDSLVLEVRDMPFSYHERSTVVHKVHGMFCTACKEGFADPAHPADWRHLGDEMQRIQNAQVFNFIS